LGDKITKNEMGNEGEVIGGEHKGKRPLKNIGVSGRRILKWMTKKRERGHELD
jgi:hypothetical protein